VVAHPGKGEPATQEKSAPDQAIPRRRFLFGVLGASVAGFMASVLALIRSLVPPRSKTSGYVPTLAPGDVLVYASGSRKGQILRASDFTIGDGVLAYAQGKEENQANLVMVMRLPKESLKPPTRLDWTDKGFVAYSAICTHLSCVVSWDRKPELAASQIQCYCHNSFFDPRRGAKVLAGPAPRPLPQLPIRINEEDVIEVIQNFTEPVGPQV